jgi:DnaK suppressor protein
VDRLLSILTVSSVLDNMEQNDLDYFKDLLTKWLQELVNQANNTISGFSDSDDNPPDPLDRAIVDSQRNYKLRMRDRESILIRKIMRSLEDIEDQVYGICEECGGDISIARLKARPVARHCIDCKTQQEAVEKSIGF